MVHLPAAFALLFVPLFAFCDREVGDGEKGAVKRVPAMDIAILGGGLLAFLTLGPYFVAVGALWAAGRSIGFGNGDLDPSTPKDAWQCARRYLIWLPLSVQAYWAGGDWKLLMGLMALAACLVMAMRLHFGAMTRMARAGGYQPRNDENAFIEKAGGALFGAALAAYALRAMFT